jgi:hypothetical protein
MVKGNMGRKYHLYKVLVALFLLNSNMAQAAVPSAPLHFIGRYQFDWNNIPLGALELGIDETANTYKMRLAVESKGAINLFTHHTNDTNENGRYEGMQYMPEHYESYYKTKNKPRHIKLAFDKKGVVTEEVNEPPEDRNDRAEVPHNLKDGAVDPLTAVMMIRAGQTNFRGFDAKRLFEVKAIAAAPTVINQPFPLVNNQKALPYILSREPLAGITAKEMKEFKKGEPPLTLYFSDNARRIPLGITVPFYGVLRGMLMQECTKWEECAVH